MNWSFEPDTVMAENDSESEAKLRIRKALAKTIKSEIGLRYS